MSTGYNATFTVDNRRMYIQLPLEMRPFELPIGSKFLYEGQQVTVLRQPDTTGCMEVLLDQPKPAGHYFAPRDLRCRKCGIYYREATMQRDVPCSERLAMEALESDLNVRAAGPLTANGTIQAGDLVYHQGDTPIG